MASGRILVVDDEQFFLKLFEEGLAEAGHVTRVASSGQEALNALSEESFDVVVTDVVMPGMDGLALVKEARRLNPEIEVVAITGRDDVRLAVEAMKAGCADFLQKPIDQRELIEVTERALARAQLRREHSQLLSENIEFVKSQALYRQGLLILSTLDGEHIQDLALAVLSRVTDAQGVALWSAEEHGKLLLRAYRGLVDRTALPARIEPAEPGWREALRSQTPFPAPGFEMGDAFMVPLRTEDELLGLVLLSDRARGQFGPEQSAAALTVADFTAIAMKNARRFQAVERVGLRDRETGAYNLAYFVDYAGKEFYKARRYARAFSLSVLSFDNAEEVRKLAGRELFRRTSRDIVAAVSRVVRDADILAKVSDSQYYVLLPETDYFGALMFVRRAREEIAKEESIKELKEKCPVLLSMGAATYPKDGEDFDELLHWARSRVEDQRDSLLRKLPFADLDPAAFWEMTDVLLSDQARLPEGASSARVPVDRELFELAQREAAFEIGRDPRARGLLYVGVGGGLSLAPVLAALPPGDGVARAGDATVQVWLLGPRGREGDRVQHPLVSEVYLDGDKRFAGHEFLLFISEHSAYGLICGPGGRMFHTSDVPLVDALVSKLQVLYDLQPA